MGQQFMVWGGGVSNVHGDINISWLVGLGQQSMAWGREGGVGWRGGTCQQFMVQGVNSSWSGGRGLIVHGQGAKVHGWGYGSKVYGPGGGVGSKVD